MLQKLAKPVTCLLVQTTYPVCRYLVVRRSSPRPTLLATGAFEPNSETPLVEQLQQHVADQRIRGSQVVLLVPRSDLEMDTLRLPPADDEELPELVQNLVAQKAEDDGATIHSDFLVRHEEANESKEVLTFSMSHPAIQEWQQQFKAVKLRLASVTFGGLGAVRLLSQVTTKPAITSLVVTTTDQDTDLVVVERGRPIAFRTIPRAAGGERFAIDQLAHEIHRTLTLEGHPEDESTRVYLIGSVEEQEQAAQLLSDKLSLSVSVVNPFDQLAGECLVSEPSKFANLVGIACAWNDEAMQIDLVHPRQGPTKGGPWGRVAFWGVIAASLLALGGFLFWEQVAEDKQVLMEHQARLQRLIKPVTRSESTRKMVEAIEDWRRTDICWLDEFRALSDQLPPAEQATVRSLTMSTLDARGRIDLALEVSDPKVRMDLEQAIRDERHAVTSKRVTDTSRQDASTWQFQTTIMIAAPPPPDLELPESVSADDTPDKVSAEGDPS